MADTNRIAELVAKHLNGNQTKEEESELEAWLAEDPQHRALYEEWADEQDLPAKLADFQAIQTRMRADWQNISAKYNFLPVKSQKRLYVYLRPMLAAAAVILLVFSIWLFVHPGHPAVKPLGDIPRFKNDVNPGTNKAVLTLSDGATIMLDSANNGLLARQGTVQVIKLDSGRLAYRPAGDKQLEMLYNTIRTPTGGQYQLMLPDGTKVWLNAASSLHYPALFMGSQREVELTGEAYFEVAKNPNAPFYVKTRDNAQVRVLGTHFNVMAYMEEPGIKTTLLEGLVKVSQGSRSVVINPGEQAELNPDGLHVGQVDAASIVAWKDGYFQFYNADISSVMRQVSRWYDVSVSFDGKISGGVSGMIPRNSSLVHLLKLLEQTGKMSFRLDGRQVTVSPPEGRQEAK